MLDRLKRHPLPIAAHFRHSLVITYAWPRQLLEPLLPPGLVLDTHGDFGFTAIALVQTERLRPTFVSASLGLDFFLTGYRIFVRIANGEVKHHAEHRASTDGGDAGVLEIGETLLEERDGELVHFMHRHQIEGRSPQSIAADLTAAFDRHFPVAV